MIGSQDLLGLILFCYLPVVSLFGKEANQAKVPTSLFILDHKFEFNDTSGCIPKSAMAGLEGLGHSQECSYGSTDIISVNFLQYTWKNTFELKKLLLIILVDFFIQISCLDHYPCPRPCVFMFSTNQI